MADGPDVAVPRQSWQPYDATSDATVAGWDKLPDDFPDGPGPWQQV